MAINFKSFFQGIGLIPVTTLTLDSKGQLQVLDSSGKMSYHDGSTFSPLVTEAQTATLTNKTLTSPTINTPIINISDNNFIIQDNSDPTKQIKFDAAGTTGTSTTILSSQTTNSIITIPDTTADTIILQVLPQALLNKTITVKDTNLTITDDTVTSKHLKFDASAIGVSTTRTLTAPNANTTIVGTDVTQILTNKTIDADLNTITNIENASIKALAAIDRSKIADGTGDYVLVNGPFGNLEEEQFLSTFRGGTGLDGTAVTYPSTGIVVTEAGTENLSNKTFSDAITSTEIATPSFPAAGTLKIYPKTDGFLYTLDNVGTETQIGSGAGGINYIQNTGAESSTIGVSAFNTTFVGGIPTTITGGSTKLSVVRDTTASEVLRGVASFQMNVTTAVASTGHGLISSSLTINNADLAKMLTFTADYAFVAGASNVDVSGTSTQTVEIWIYNVNSNTWTQPSGFRGINTKSATQVLPGSLSTEFQTDSSASNNIYKIAVIIRNDPTGTFKLNFDNLVFGPNTRTYGAPITDWTAFTPTGTWVANTTWTGFYRRIGDSIQVHASATLLGGGPTGTFTMNMPAGIAIDISKITGVANNSPLGIATGANAGNGWTGIVQYNSSTVIDVYGPNVGAWTATVPVSWGSGNIVSINFVAPVVGWSSSVQTSDTTDTRIVAANYTSSSGQVYGAPLVMPFATKVFDTHSAWSVSNKNYVVPVSGFYKCSFSALFDPMVYVINEEIRVDIRKNTIVIAAKDYRAETATTHYASLSNEALVQCIAGDVLDFYLTPNTTNNPTAAANASFVYMNIERLSGPSVIASSEKINARYTSTSTASVGASPVQIDFDTKTFDSHGAVTTGASWKFTSPRASKYRVSAGADGSLVAFQIGRESIVLEMFKNGVAYSVLSFQSGQSTATVNPHCFGSDTIDLLAGEYLDVRVNRYSGMSSWNLSGNQEVVKIAIESID